MTLHFQPGSVRKLVKLTACQPFAPARLASDWLALHAEVTRLQEEVNLLRGYLIAWEPRVVCPQCGQRYTASACGPSHIALALALRPEEPEV